VSYSIPTRLRRNISNSTGGDLWLQELPDKLADLSTRWSLTIGPPVEDDATCSWVAPCKRGDGSDAILKLGFPHMEAEHEIDALAFWSGEPCVQLLDADRNINALLLERCVPGTTLRQRPEHEQDTVIADLLKRLWRVPDAGQPFRPLARMIEHWCAGSREKSELWPDPGLTEEGMNVFDDLLRDDSDPVLLATDLHAGNVLRGQRLPWIVIDPKPFVGDRCYDATQHLLNCPERLRADPFTTISRFAELLEVDGDRVRLWTFARLAVESHAEMASSHTLARSLLI
jgi:streptomycin 6-kinase